LGADIEVETHIEPLETRELPGHDADPELTRSLGEALARLAAQDGTLREIHDVRLRAAAGGYFGIFHCRVDPATTVEAAHRKVDALETAVRREFPEILRLVGHVEPAR
jgi:divalent metal cation (Fe/Co/Zn/Cd) transporter